MDEEGARRGQGGSSWQLQCYRIVADLSQVVEGSISAAHLDSFIRHSFVE